MVKEPSEVALRLRRWPYLSQFWLIASQSADDTVPISFAGFGYMEHAVSRCTSSQMKFNLR